MFGATSTHLPKLFCKCVGIPVISLHQTTQLMTTSQKENGSLNNVDPVPISPSLFIGEHPLIYKLGLIDMGSTLCKTSHQEETPNEGKRSYTRGCARQEFANFIRLRDHTNWTSGRDSQTVYILPKSPNREWCLQKDIDPGTHWEERQVNCNFGELRKLCKSFEQFGSVVAYMNP